jgi:alpha-2-macroglobulin
MEKSYNTDVENIVITDLLPSGMDIENPRTKYIPGINWIKESSSPAALDVRDDRINFFVDLRNLKQVYYYAVRAVSPGIYKMGPVRADAVYKEEYHSYFGAGTIKVVQ